MEVLVIAPGHPGIPSRESRRGVKVLRVQYFWPASLQKLAYGWGIPWNLRGSLLAWVNLPFFLLLFGLAICRHARRADVVHAHWGVLGALATLTRLVHRRPVVVTLHEISWRRQLAPVVWLTLWAVRHADAVTTPSQEFAGEFRALRVGLYPCQWVPNGVGRPSAAEQRDTDRMRDHECGTFQIVTVGRLIPERKHDVLLRALAHVRRQFPSAKLTVVGDGPQRQALKSLAQELGLSEAVEFTGRVPVEEVSSYLGSADLYVSPTMAESFGLALVEAAAHGLPIIATPVGMAPVLILEGQTGRIIPAGDEHSLAEAIIGVIGNPIFRREAALLMPKRVEELGFTWPRCAERTAGIYRDLLVRRGNGRL